MVGSVPPSMMWSAPVIAELRSETRKATSSATSSGLVGRPSGIPPREHDLLQRGGSVDLVSVDDARDEPFGSAAFDEARGDGIDADAVWRELVGQALAVGGQRGLCCGVGQG